MIETYFYESPIGWISIQTEQNVLHSLQFMDKNTISDHTSLSLCARSVFEELDRYFEYGGHRFTMDIHPLGTPFQQKVWELVKKIPAGKTTTYAELANQFGNIDAARAIGTALGKNPILILLPCHRVIAANGSLTGYAGGLTRKKWLLEHEGFLKQKTLHL